jgi:hypothetical protein
VSVVSNSVADGEGFAVADGSGEGGDGRG